MWLPWNMAAQFNNQGEHTGSPAPDGGKDENVFDIQQGVAIGLFVKEAGKTGPAKVHHADLWGTRGHWPNPQPQTKYHALAETDIASTDWEELEPNSPFYFFVPQCDELRPEYEKGWKVTGIFPVNSTGIVTARDNIVIDFDRHALEERLVDFADASTSDETIRQRYFGHKKQANEYSPGDTRGWKLPEARKKLSTEQSLSDNIRPFLYRPFDIRPLYYTAYMVDWPRPEVVRHMLAGKNVAMVTTRQTRDPFGVLASAGIVGHKSVAAYDINSLFPLYLYPSEQEVASGLYRAEDRRPNLSPVFIKTFSEKLGLQFMTDGRGDLEGTFGPEDIFNYAYAVFHSPAYRSRYAEFLKTDFPRLPLTSDRGLFKALCERGAELVALHLMESPALSNLITTYTVSGTDIVERVDYNEPERRVYINKTQYFEGVPPEVWSFHIGGYQVCQKWLKDRKGRKLTYDERVHYQKVVVALKETIRLMAEIDAVIPGWPFP